MGARFSKRVVIIGLGWLGLPLAEHLQAKGWQVAGTKRTVTEGKIPCCALDLNQLPENTPETLLPFLAYEAMVIALPPGPIGEENYLKGVQWLVNKGRENGLKQLVFISSTSVFTSQAGHFDEKSATLPNHLLVKVENWLRAQPLSCDIVRLAGLVGKARHPVYYLAGKRDLAAPSQAVNLVHLQDCINAITLLLENPQGQRTFHLCAAAHPSRAHYYGETAARLGLAAPHFLAEDPANENAPVQRIIVAEKICRELDFHYQYPDPNHFPLPDPAQRD